MIQPKYPNFKIQMGFGIHLGWAIEGAIGSQFKIDASYLSPNVNMCARLGAATKQYEVEIILSEQIQQACSNELNQYLREIDRVIVKGSHQPVRLFTVDLDFKNLKPGKHMKMQAKIQKRKQAKLYLQDKLMNDTLFKAFTLIENSKSMKLCIQHQSQKFYTNFAEAYQFYQNGNWREAVSILQNGLNLRQDGPSSTLINFMKEQNCQNPLNWQGYRSLLNK